LALEAAGRRWPDSQAFRVDLQSAVGAPAVHALFEPLQRSLAFMEILQVTARVGKVGGGLIIGD
jgi:hypothetical protein